MSSSHALPRKPRNAARGEGRDSDASKASRVKPAPVDSLAHVKAGAGAHNVVTFSDVAGRSAATGKTEVTPKGSKSASGASGAAQAARMEEYYRKSFEAANEAARKFRSAAAQLQSLSSQMLSYRQHTMAQLSAAASMSSADIATNREYTTLLEETACLLESATRNTPLAAALSQYAKSTQMFLENDIIPSNPGSAPTHRTLGSFSVEGSGFGALSSRKTAKKHLTQGLRRIATSGGYRAPKTSTSSSNASPKSEEVSLSDISLSSEREVLQELRSRQATQDMEQLELLVEGMQNSAQMVALEAGAVLDKVRRMRAHHSQDSLSVDDRRDSNPTDEASDVTEEIIVKVARAAIDEPGAEEEADELELTQYLKSSSVDVRPSEPTMDAVVNSGDASRDVLDFEDWFELADYAQLIADNRRGPEYVRQKYAALDIVPRTLPKSSMSYMTLVMPHDRFAEIPPIHTTVDAHHANDEHEGEQLLMMIVIRGTDFTNLKHLMLDLDSKMEFEPELGIRLHRGFLTAARELFADVAPYIKQKSAELFTKSSLLSGDDISTAALSPARKTSDGNDGGKLEQSRLEVRICGHSLGAAVAQLLAVFLLRDGFRVTRVTAFGAPKVTDRIGGAELGKYLDSRCLRVSNYMDVVRTLPRKSEFHHFGRSLLVFDDGTSWYFARAPPREPFKYSNYSLALAHHRTKFYASMMARVVNLRLGVQFDPASDDLCEPASSFDKLALPTSDGCGHGT